MELDANAQRLTGIFFPGALERMMGLVESGTRFAYYTSADTAMKILENEVLWLRNATVMNDFMEVSYGLELIQNAFASDKGQRFKDAVETIFEGTMQQVDDLYQGWEYDWQVETYIACVSVHDPSEDSMDRLSMWRAYGDTALIVKNTPMVAVTDLLGVFSVPVNYLSQEDYNNRIEEIAQQIEENADFIREFGQQNLVNHIHHMLFATAISTKHPGFKEEQEWRIYYRPSERESPLMKRKTEVLNGVPQVIYELPLRDSPDEGLHGADIPSLLDRIIVGPTEYPRVSVEAFKDVLKKKGVADFADKVIASDIPLRAR